MVVVKHVPRFDQTEPDVVEPVILAHAPEARDRFRRSVDATWESIGRLRALGYREVTLTADVLIGAQGARIRGHEFHYSRIVAGLSQVEPVFRMVPPKPTV